MRSILREFAILSAIYSCLGQNRLQAESPVMKFSDVQAGCRSKEIFDTFEEIDRNLIQ